MRAIHWILVVGGAFGLYIAYLIVSDSRQAISALLDVPFYIAFYILGILERIGVNPVVGLAMLVGNIMPIVLVILGVHYFRKWRARKAE